LKLEKFEEDGSLIVAIISRYLDNKRGHVQTSETGCEYDYQIQTDHTEDTVILGIDITISGEVKSLSLKLGVVSEKDKSCIMITEDTDYLDLLHNYALDDRHELLEIILSAAYVLTPPDTELYLPLTPPDTELYLPLSEQAKAALKAKRKNDRSLLSLQKIAKNAGFPFKNQEYEKIESRHFLRCKKSVIPV
jgi:hypothetical protein